MTNEEKHDDYFDFKECAIKKFAKLNTASGLLIAAFTIVLIALGYSFIYANGIDNKTQKEHKLLATSASLMKVENDLKADITKIERHLEKQAEAIDKLEKSLPAMELRIIKAIGKIKK